MYNVLRLKSISIFTLIYMIVFSGQEIFAAPGEEENAQDNTQPQSKPLAKHITMDELFAATQSSAVGQQEPKAHASTQTEPLPDYEAQLARKQLELSDLNSKFKELSQLFQSLQQPSPVNASTPAVYQQMMQWQCAQMQMQIAYLASTNQAFDQENNTLAQENNSLRQQLEYLTERNNHLLRSLKATRAESNHAFQNQQSMQTSLAQQLTTFERTVHLLSEQRDELNATNKYLSLESEKAKNEVATLRQELDVLKRQLASCQHVVLKPAFAPRTVDATLSSLTGAPTSGAPTAPKYRIKDTAAAALSTAPVPAQASLTAEEQVRALLDAAHAESKSKNRSVVKDVFRRNFTEAKRILDSIQSSNQTLKAEMLLGYGRVKKDASKFQEALQLLGENGDPLLRAKAHVYLGNKHVQSEQNYDKAIQLLEQIQGPDAQLLLAEAYIGYGNAVKGNSQQYYERALAILKSTPNDKLKIKALMGLGNCCTAHGRHRQAIECYERAIEAASCYGPIKGEVEMKLRRMIQKSQRALTKEPKKQSA